MCKLFGDRGTSQAKETHMQSVEDRIRELAYSKWEKAGYPGGDGVSFWLQAEAELYESEPELAKTRANRQDYARAAHKSPTKK
jgi:hypothetical protein